MYRLQRARALFFGGHFQKRAVKSAADQFGLRDQRINIRTLYLIQERHGEVNVGANVVGQAVIVRHFIGKIIAVVRTRNVLLRPHCRTFGQYEFRLFFPNGHRAAAAVHRADAVTESIPVVIGAHDDIQIKLPALQSDRRFVALVFHFGRFAGHVFVRAFHLPRIDGVHRRQIKIVLRDVQAERGIFHDGRTVFFHRIRKRAVPVHLHSRDDRTVRRGNFPVPAVDKALFFRFVAASGCAEQEGTRQNQTAQ